MLAGTLTLLCWKIGVSQASDFYLCGPLHSCRICAMGCETGRLAECAHGNLQFSRGYYPWGRRVFIPPPRAARIWPLGPLRAADYRRLGRNSSLLELAEACDVRSNGRAEPESAACMTGLIDGSITWLP
jgi:hypothetical protein